MQRPGLARTRARDGNFEAAQTISRFAFQASASRPRLGGPTRHHFPAFQQKFLTGKITPGPFEWFDPPERQALREIELSQDEAAKRAARIA